MDVVGTEVLELMSISLCVPYLGTLNVKFFTDPINVLKSESDDYVMIRYSGRIEQQPK